MEILLKLNDRLSDMKKEVIKDVIRQIDSIDINLLNHKVPKNKL